MISGDKHMDLYPPEQENDSEPLTAKTGSIFPPRNVKADLCFYGFVLAMFTVSRLLPKKIKHVHKLPKNQG
jgi:hypothetical protein